MRDYSEVDIPVLRHKFVNFGVKKSPVASSENASTLPFLSNLTFLDLASNGIGYTPNPNP